MPPHNPLQLADALESLENPRLHLLPYAASELRRLHEAHEWQYKMAGERLRRIEQDEALLQQALEVLEGLFGIPKQFTGAGGGGVAVWRLGGPAPVREAIAVLKNRLGIFHD